MQKLLYITLALLATMMPAMLTSCSETTDEDTEYADWQSRNDTYFTSIYNQAGTHIANGDTNWKVIRCYTKDPETVDPTDYIVAEVLTESTDNTSPLFTDSVKVHYRGTLMPSASYPNGYQFDSSWTGDYNLNTMMPSSGVTSGYIDGFSTALMNMHQGDRWRVYIPYALGYNTTEKTGIPAYSTLVFDLTLVKTWR